MKNKRYIMCGGLAFCDDQDMKRLHDYAKKGWIFRRLRAGVVYELCREEPQDIIFDYDLQRIKDDEKEEYMRVFEDAGWQLVGKWDKDVRFFYAKEGTISLHSAKETREEQFKLPYYISIVITLVGIACLWIGVKTKRFGFYPLGGACIGGGSVLWIGTHLRLHGKKLSMQSNSYRFYIVQGILGSIFIATTILQRDWNIYNYITLIIGVWFVVGTGIGVYRKWKEKRELYD